MSVFDSKVGLDTAFGYLDRKIQSNQVFNPTLIANTENNDMLRAIKHELKSAQSFDFSIAFITSSALALLKQDLLNFEGRGRIITSTYLQFNEPAVFKELLQLENVEVRVLKDSVDAFHSKGYVFEHADGTTAIIGSSNLTRNALISNTEWNVRFSAMPDGDIALQVRDAVARLEERSKPLTAEWIESYEESWKPVPQRNKLLGESDEVIPVGRIRPNAMQSEALEKIKQIRESNARRAVVISATGTGKTILAALSVREAKPTRMLFIVHREQILDKAILEFQKVLEAPAEDFGKFVGSTRQQDRRYVFASIQSLSREENLHDFDPAAFDFIVVDEVHRAGAETYLRTLEHFQPTFLLGLTATPERTDGFNVFELFDYNVAYEIRLQKALESKMLAPFSYYGVTDYIDDQGKTIEETSSLSKLLSTERVKHLREMLTIYGRADKVTGLMFCSSRKEATELSTLLNEESVFGHRLRTKALTGKDSPQTRNAVIKELEDGELDYVLTVDIFNEGIDIPAVNQVVMLRNTESSIIFTQQLGRGLRKADGKDHLRVIDFIGNYKNNFLVPIALFGDSSLNKDVIRKRLRDADESGSIAGISSISFDKISEQRVLESLAQTSLDTLHQLKQSFSDLEFRLGRQPWRIDFAIQDTVQPTIIATAKSANYWDFLIRAKKETQVPSTEQSAFLTFLDNELLNGLRPHELLLLRQLLEQDRVSVEDLRALLKRYSPRQAEQGLDTLTLKSVSRILDLSFFTQNEKAKYGNLPLASFENDVFTISKKLRLNYDSSPLFAHHVSDSIETGLRTNRESYAFQGRMLPGKQYSRKDVCRMLNWENNQYSTMYGYAANEDTKTCPIFITYHKADDISDSTKYEDKFDNPSVISWFSKSNRRLNSKIEQRIVSGEYALEVFVKKDDAEGNDFHYLGQAHSRDAVETTIPTAKKPMPIVNMRLDLMQPVSPGLYEYFTRHPSTN